MKIISLIYIFISSLSAVGEAGAIFLLISPGAGPQGTGEAQVAKADDAYASYYNPAGFGFLEGREAVGMHVQWLPNLADDLYYEFLAYRHHIKGLGSIGGHIIYLNLGEQIGMDAMGNPTDNWMSFMGAVSASFGTKLSKNSSIGFNAKIFHQKLADQVAEGEEGKGNSTDFAFDIGYLKKFKQSSQTIINKKVNSVNRWFEELIEIYDNQQNINEKIENLLNNKSNIYDVIENQEINLDEIKIQKDKLSVHKNLDSHMELDEQLLSIISEMGMLIDSLFEFSSIKKSSDLKSEKIDNLIKISEKILFDIMKIEPHKKNIITDLKKIDIKDNLDDKFNIGFCISNIGPKIAFVDADQADPSPTNMRMGIFAQLYNDGNNKLNFLFDANKLLVSRYEMMDWDGDGYVGGYDKSGNWMDIADASAIYNEKGQQEYHELGYFDDPWYLAIFTSWLDDWYYGGDLDQSGGITPDRKIGGYTCSGGGTAVKHSLDEYDCEGGVWTATSDLTFDHPEYGIFGNPDTNGKAKIEKGSGDGRTFLDEFKNMIYNVGLEYWYTDNFALRAGYIYDNEGEVINPTFGAGLRLLQYGFDFGYTAGEQGDSRANTMFFSINMKL